MPSWLLALCLTAFFILPAVYILADEWITIRRKTGK